MVNLIFKIMLSFVIVTLSSFCMNEINDNQYYVEYTDLKLVQNLDIVDNKKEIISFSVSNNNYICVSFKEFISEYDNNGNLIRNIYYVSNNVIKGYYNENNNLILHKNNMDIEIDSFGNYIKGYKKNDRDLKQLNQLFEISDYFMKDISYNKNNYNYKYINTNFFERIFKKKESKIIVLKGEQEIFCIEEKTSLRKYSFLFIPIMIPIILISIKRRQQKGFMTSSEVFKKKNGI